MDREITNKRFWENVAKWYTPLQERKNARLYQDLCEVISKSLDKNMQVLELACGTGQLTIPLCKKVASWEATDFSEKMIQEAKVRAANFPVTLAVQDATNLKYEDGRFDAVVIANALHIMPEPHKALMEINRVLKKGGLLIAPTFVYDGKINKLRIWLMERIGFHTFYKWKSHEYIEFISNRGFHIIDSSVIQGEMLPECILICKTN
ncbi:class I SAM-dependent methyltransferase [Clostridium sp. C2-6-12]|uniref:class I SAM-dependent methyltransferase n=1 Tax=Clostridium sp. C2-6-12 TaxID=2698832 RepID=UPI00136AD5A3|nr:class I SAM-dependent methyltransferase [Clostridium sp. C2-6-12]